MCTQTDNLKATSHSAIFRACKYAIKDTERRFTLKRRPAVPVRIGNYSFEFCPLHASHT